MSLGIAESNGVLIWLPNRHICYLKINEWFFLQKIFSQISPANDTRLLVCCELSGTLRFYFTLRTSNEVTCTTSLGNWSTNTIMCIAICGSRTKQDWQRRFKYGAWQIISRHPPLNFGGLKKFLISVSFCCVLLLLAHSFQTNVNASLRVFYNFLLFTNLCWLHFWLLLLI